MTKCVLVRMLSYETRRNLRFVVTYVFSLRNFSKSKAAWRRHDVCLRIVFIYVIIVITSLNPYRGVHLPRNT